MLACSAFFGNPFSLTNFSNQQNHTLFTMVKPNDQDYAPNAVIVEGIAHNGKPCRLVDNTGTVSREELEALLKDLISNKEFGLKGVSQGETLTMGGTRFTHVQVGDSLYRLLLFPYEARLEKF